MNHTLAEVKKECEQRMSCIGLSPKIIENFKKGIIYCSRPFGTVSRAQGIEEQLISKFELENACTVYHVIYGITNIGEIYNFLYVSDKDMTYWDSERAATRNGYPVVYVENLTFPENSEFGTIGVRNINGGLVRIS